jgi:hypothetical protein
MPQLRLRFWGEAILGLTGLALAVATIFRREWIELLVGVDPDHGNGSVEWLVVGVLLLASISFAVAARLEWRHAHAH